MPYSQEMPNYRYTLQTLDSSGRRLEKVHYILHVDTSDAAEIRELIYLELLTRHREERMQQLLAWYEGDIRDTQALRAFVPDIFKPFITDDDVLGERYKLLQQLCSLWEINMRYTVKNIEVEKCGACATELPEPDSHTECPTGCQHDPARCWMC